MEDRLRPEAKQALAQVNLDVIESHGSQELQMSTQPLNLKKLILSDKASITSQHTTSLIHDNYEVLSSQHLKKPPKHKP